MGVSGLTQYLQKTYPHIIHRLPNRLKEIAGKRIVIDGTLITQRLHYAPSAHPSRHVLGWYHLGREMNENGVSAVCIFDGQKRSKAKAEESHRRRELRRLEVSRGHVEILRTKRLQAMKSLVAGVRSLDDTGKSRVAEMLSRLNPSDGAGTVGAVDGLNRVGERLRVLSDGLPSEFTSERFSSAKPLGGEVLPFPQTLSEVMPPAEPPVEEIPPPLRTLSEVIPPFTEPTIKEILPRVETPTEALPAAGLSTEETPTILPSAEPPSKEVPPVAESPNINFPSAKPSSALFLSQKTVDSDEDAQKPSTSRVTQLSQPQDSGFLGLGYSRLDAPAPSIPSVEALRATLLNLYRDFRLSISKVASFPLPGSKVKPIFSSADEPGIQEEDDLVLSRTQCELTLEEGRVWDELTLATATATPSASPAAVENDAATPSIHTFSNTAIPLVSTPLLATTSSPSATGPTTPFPLTSTLTTPAHPTATFTIPSPPTTVSTVPTSLPAPKSSEFAIDQLLLQAAEDRLDTLRMRSEIVAESYQRRMNAPTRNTYMESKEILEAMGILCYEIEEEHEGEALASSLVLKGLADYVVSEDSDVLVYGAPLIRNLSNRGEPLVLIYGDDVRGVLDLSEDAYIDFALLLGTDFTKRIRNVGPHRAHKFIQEYGSIESIIDGQSKYQPTSRTDYLAQVNAARAIFRSLAPVPDRLAVSMMPTEFGFGVVDQAKVNIIMERCGLGKVLMTGVHWEYEAALAGNYFDDNPRVFL